MSLVMRIWVTLTSVVALTLAVLAVLAILQHDAVLSQLIRQRLAVTVEATARPFRSVAEMGLPISMMRNKEALVNRARSSDPAIRDVILFDPAATIVAKSGSFADEPVPESAVKALFAGADRGWSSETDAELMTGTAIFDDAGKAVGGIIAIYPKTELRGPSADVARSIALAAAILFFLFSGLAYLAVRWHVHPVAKGLRRLESTLASLDGADAAAGNPAPIAPTRSTLERALDKLRRQLDAASARYRQELLAIGASKSSDVKSLTGPRRTELVGIPEGAATRDFARRIALVVLALTLGSALALGYFAYRSIDTSFGPEIARRTELIGAIATSDIQRSLAAGVPIDALAGGAEYLEHVLSDFPEIAYFAVTNDKTVIEVGQKRKSGAIDRSVFPIMVDGSKIGEIVAEQDPEFVVRQFKEVVIDLGVIVLVIILLSFELIVVMMTRAVTGPLDRLQYLAELQAGGDFSRRLLASGSDVIGRLGAALSERAEQICALSAKAVDAAAERTPGLPPASLRFCNLTDVRLPLFLFAMADELPLSFFSLFARAQDNPLPWLGEGVVIGLPLAAYLTAALAGAPLARPLGQRLGYRRLFILAALLTFAAKLGLFQAGNIAEVIVFHGINGFAFVLAALSCQDYAIDMLPKSERARSLGLFRAALFSGVFAATALGGILADRLGERPVFVVCAGLSVVSALLIWRMLPATGQTAVIKPVGVREAISFNFVAPMRNPAFAAVALGSVIPLAIVDHVFVSYLLALQMDALGATVSEIGRVMMYFFLALIVGSNVQGRLPSAEAKPERVLMICSAVAGALLIGSTLVPSTWATLAATIGAGAALGFAGGPQIALVMEAAEQSLTPLGASATLGTIRVIERGGAVVGLFAIGWLTDTIGYDGAAGMIGAATLAGAGLFGLFHFLSKRGANSGRQS